MKSVSPLVFSANLKTIINIPTLPLSKVLPPFSILLLTKIPATPIWINTSFNLDKKIHMWTNTFCFYQTFFFFFQFCLYQNSLPPQPATRGKTLWWIRLPPYVVLNMYSMRHWISQTFLCSWFWPLAKSKSLLNLLNFLYLGPAVGLARQKSASQTPIFKSCGQPD